MARITPIHYRKLAKVFEKDGWFLVKQTGSHLQYKKEGMIRRVVIPCYQQVPVFVIKNNLRTAGISREEYFKLLDEI